MGKLYLYLLRRNKKDVKIIGSISSTILIPATRMEVDMLGLPAQERLKLTQVIQQHQVEWEPWLESAEAYKQLRESLEKRRIVAPSSPNAPLIDFAVQELPKASQIKLTKNRVMTRRMN